MERSDIQMMGMLGIFMALMVLSQYVPKPFDMVAVFGTYVGLIGYMIVADWALKVKLASWVAIEAVIIPKMRRETLMVKKLETVAREGQTHTTRIHLAFPYKDEEGGRTNVIYLHHYGSLMRRLDFQPSRIRFSGRSIEHPQTESVILVKDPRGYVDHAKLYPMFHLVASTKDGINYFRTYLESMAGGSR